MSNMLVQTSFGAGKIITDNGLKPFNSVTPSGVEIGDENEFRTYIFGNPLDKPHDAKTHLFTSRDLVAFFDCTFIGKNRDGLREERHDVACHLVDEFCKYSTREVVVVNNFGIVADDETTKDVYQNLFGVISDIAMKHYKAISVEICLFFNDTSQLKDFVLKYTGSAIKVVEESNAVLLYL